MTAQDRYLHCGENDFCRHGRSVRKYVVDLLEKYRDRHLRGALNIPYERRKNCCLFPKNVLLVFYCDRGSLSMAAAREYAGKGYRTRTVVGGLSAYQGKETESFR